MGWKGIVGIGGCVVGLGVVYFGYGIGNEAPKKQAMAEVTPAAQPKRPVRAMNLALGNMVYFARDLGFSVKNSAGAAVDGVKIAARIENQLHALRELYRREIARNEGLAGSAVLQFRIAPNGDVSDVRELGGRMWDGEFRKAVTAQAGTWSFAELVTESLEVTCPLLFVHEGMDITTLVQWERSLAAATTRVAVLAPHNPPVPAQGPAATAAPTRPPTKSDDRQYQIKYATALRKDPNFSAPSLTTLTIGSRITVLRRQGDWLEVRSRPQGPTGFIRKEFVTPLEIARQ